MPQSLDERFESAFICMLRGITSTLFLHQETHIIGGYGVVQHEQSEALLGFEPRIF
jgi:hypothetical protein